MTRLKSFLCAAITAAVALSFAFAMMMPAPAHADGLDASKHWVGNVLFGWADCGKGAADEVGKAQHRAYVGVLVTAPLSCGVNVATRYVGNVADLVSIPVSGTNVVNPPTLSSWTPPVRF
jgi:hypothetical protein